MARRQSRLLLFGLMCSVAAAWACNNNNNSTTAPSPIETTETFNGTINPNGTATHAFTVNYQSGYTDAKVTLTALTSVATGATPNITVGIGFGNYSVGVCTRASAVSNPAASLNQELPTTNQPFGPGPYCLQIFDNPDAPTITEPLRYTMKLVHY